MIPSFLPEDLALVAHADLPPLNKHFPGAPPLDAVSRAAMLSSLELKLQNDVRTAQREGWLPPDPALESLPAFRQATEDDASYVQRAEQEEAARQAAQRAAAEEAARREAERRQRAEEEAATKARQRLDAKEVRRQERLTAEREARARAHAEERRRYDELHSRWQAAVGERQAKLDGVQRLGAAAEDRKAAVVKRLAELGDSKAALLKQLCDLAARPELEAQNSPPPTAPQPQPPSAGKSEPKTRWEDHTYHHQQPLPQSPPSSYRYASSYDAFGEREDAPLPLSRAHSYDLPRAGPSFQRLQEEGAGGDKAGEGWQHHGRDSYAAGGAAGDRGGRPGSWRGNSYGGGPNAAGPARGGGGGRGGGSSHWGDGDGGGGGRLHGSYSGDMLPPLLPYGGGGRGEGGYRGGGAPPRSGSWGGRPSQGYRDGGPMEDGHGRGGGGGGGRGRGREGGGAPYGRSVSYDERERERSQQRPGQQGQQQWGWN